MRDKRIWAAVLAIGLGAAIWAASPVVTGRKEPWDAAGPYYLLALLVSGFLVGFATRGSGSSAFVTTFVGLFLGQLLYMLAFLRIGPLIVIGLGFLGVYSGLGALAAVGGSRVGRWAPRARQ
ncbi:MAG TPA: hypothetical protein VFO18_15105 [Methylomirabilota bacterium]|nr:hypothetical protein [Methylomirabilota bacterium]